MLSRDSGQGVFNFCFYFPGNVHKECVYFANLYQMVCMRYALRSFILLHKCHAHSYLPPLWLIANLRHISIQLWFLKNISTWGNGHVKTESSSIRSYFMVTLWNSEDKRTELLFIPLFREQNLDITRMYTFLAIV